MSIPQPHINSIPTEVQLKVFALLCRSNPIPVLRNLSMVCRHWKSLAETAVLVPVISNDMLAKQSKGALRILDLGESPKLPLTTHALKHVALSCPNVTHLNLSSWSRLSSAQLVYILHKMPSLQHVNFSSLQAVTDISLQILARQSGRILEALNISSCSRVTEKGLQAILSDCTNIKTLKARSLNNAFTSALVPLFLGQTDTSFYTTLVPPIIDYVRPQDYNLPTPPIELTPALIYIKNLNFGGCVSSVNINLQNCSLITDVGGCSSFLSSINISGCSDVGDIALNALGMCCGRTLETVFCSQCPEITDDGVQDLVGQCSKLHMLCVNDNPLLTDSLLSYLQKDPTPSLTVLEIDGCPLVSARCVSLLLERINSLPQFRRHRRISIESIGSLWSGFSGSSSGERIMPASRRFAELSVWNANSSNTLFGDSNPRVRANSSDIYEIDSFV
ncbi:hypothetical protein BDR26DRAFT_859589 [Obelidium mucronatum]|nr:hypothetical protein BDR26DRAFT_859589 [Obelidium mucronatum]